MRMKGVVVLTALGCLASPLTVRAQIQLHPSAAELVNSFVRELETPPSHRGPTSSVLLAELIGPRPTARTDSILRELVLIAQDNSRRFAQQAAITLLGSSASTSVRVRRDWVAEALVSMYESLNTPVARMAAARAYSRFGNWTLGERMLRRILTADDIPARELLGVAQLTAAAGARGQTLLRELDLSRAIREPMTAAFVGDWVRRDFVTESPKVIPPPR